LKQTITINKKNITVSFSDYYDSELGEFLFRQVMCDVYMPGSEIVPIAMEKEQISLILEGFKNRKALYDELKKEDIKGKSFYVISPRMRYDLEWLQEKKKLPSSKDPQVMLRTDPTATAAPIIPEAPKSKPEPSQKQPVFTDSKRKYLVSKGFKLNQATNNWEIYDIRFPDSKIDKTKSDDEFVEGMTRLLEASYQNHQKRKTKTAKAPAAISDIDSKK
jgi:pyruvate/2-oxoglutarate dehydrogenase complex dihydrolipoamide acyltransferase (E2) component